VERYLANGFIVEVAATAPSLAWNREDALQDMLLRKAFRRTIARPVHCVPTADGFGAAVRADLGWGMFPEQLAGGLVGGASRRFQKPAGVPVIRSRIMAVSGVIGALPCMIWLTCLTEMLARAASSAWVTFNSASRSRACLRAG